MYSLKHANSVPIRPSIVRIGFPIQEHMVPNIVITSDNNSDPVHLNAIVLRDALLSSPEAVESLLGLKVKDVLSNKPVPKTTPKPKEPKKEDVKEAKEETPSQDSQEVDEWV